MSSPHKWRWFWLNLKIGILSIGGSGRVALYEDAVVDDLAWVTREEFARMLTFAQVLPGPNLVNLAASIGYHLFGPSGSIAVILGLCLPGAVLGVMICGWINLNSRLLTIFLGGCVIGGSAVMLSLSQRLADGLLGDGRKTTARFAVIAAVATTGMLGTPLLRTLAAGVFAGAAVEFIL